METWANVYACLTAVSGAVISGGLWSVLRLPRVCIPRLASCSATEAYSWAAAMLYHLTPSPALL